MPWASFTEKPGGLVNITLSGCPENALEFEQYLAKLNTYPAIGKPFWLLVNATDISTGAAAYLVRQGEHMQTPAAKSPLMRGCAIYVDGETPTCVQAMMNMGIERDGVAFFPTKAAAQEWLKTNRGQSSDPIKFFFGK